MHHSKKIRGGFTLIELLASMAVISVLATLLLTAGKGVFKKSLDAKCLGNLKTLHGGMAAYATDWGHWPTLNLESPTSPSEYGTLAWFESLLRQDYLPTRKETRDGFDCLYSASLICPANKVNKGRRYPWTASPYPWESNYAINENWGTRWGGSWVVPYDPAYGIDWLRSPGAINSSKAILLVDSNLESWIYPGTYADWSTANCIVPRNLHGKGAHALLANGSVITVSPESHPDLKESKYWDPRYTAQ